ncbi:alpha/beta hydrolase family protein [Sediminibacillus massiliensis]|uniref:alpha/beta hydrolase family protein n=1 Tax=Sediminibacillus massiliensis TaxID=1926277 RepID=UPI000988658D|nr:alpha/beta hydrolase family protein [Sediminibacillus massiliensis]
MDFNQEFFFESLYRKTVADQKRFVDNPEAKKYIRQGLSESLGDFPEVGGEVKNVQPILLQRQELDSFVRERIAFQTAEDLWVPVYVLTPKDEQDTHPAVLALHGHGYGSRAIVGLTEHDLEDHGTTGGHQHFGVQLVERG